MNRFVAKPTNRFGPGSTEVLRVSRVGATSMDAVVVAEMPSSRFCGCALYDDNRDEILAIGGRDADSFLAATDVRLLDVQSGRWTDIAPGGAADFPVGCMALFDPVRDEGWLFGGMSEATRVFSSATFRWDPNARSFEAIDGAGPPGRYDGVLRALRPGGPYVLSGGMGLAGPTSLAFFSDVWVFDPEGRTWTSVPAANDGPPGRRYPWMTVDAAGNRFLLGFGSDSGQGQTVLGDLWRFDIEDRLWTEVIVQGDAPAPRGFTSWLPGPEGTAGLLVSGGGGDSVPLLTDSFVLIPPDDDGDGWH